MVDALGKLMVASLVDSLVVSTAEMTVVVMAVTLKYWWAAMVIKMAGNLHDSDGYCLGSTDGWEDGWEDGCRYQFCYMHH